MTAQSPRKPWKHKKILQNKPERHQTAELNVIYDMRIRKIAPKPQRALAYCVQLYYISWPGSCRQ